MRYIAFSRPVSKHQTDRYQCERHRKVSTHAVCIENHLQAESRVIFDECSETLNCFVNFRSVKNCFIRGSVVRYVQLPGEEVDTQLLQDAARKEAVTSTR